MIDENDNFNNVDFDGIEYIYALPKIQGWLYGINSYEELNFIKQDNLVKMLNKIGIFNKDVFEDILSHHQTFVFTMENNKVTPLLFGKDIGEEIYDLVWKDIPKRKTLKERFTELFENIKFDRIYTL